MEDEGFRNQLKASPEATLAQFDLTPDEVAAIKSADPSKIQELGVGSPSTMSTLNPTGGDCLDDLFERGCLTPCPGLCQDVGRQS